MPYISWLVFYSYVYLYISAQIEQMRSSAGIGAYLEHSLPALSHRGNMPPPSDDDNSKRPFKQSLFNDNNIAFPFHQCIQKLTVTVQFAWIERAIVFCVPATTWSRVMNVQNHSSIDAMVVPSAEKTSQRSFVSIIHELHFSP
jgi:hypothetical protein